MAPLELSFVDLSCNALKTIDPVWECLRDARPGRHLLIISRAPFPAPKALCTFPKLSILYLHGNNITRLREVAKLAALPHLKSLSLHGNDIEKEKDYRLFVVHTLPQLHKLDFSAITPGERATATRTGGGASAKKPKAASS